MNLNLLLKIVCESPLWFKWMQAKAGTFLFIFILCFLCLIFWGWGDGVVASGGADCRHNTTFLVWEIFGPQFFHFNGWILCSRFQIHPIVRWDIDHFIVILNASGFHIIDQLWINKFIEGYSGNRSGLIKIIICTCKILTIFCCCCWKEREKKTTMISKW